MSPKKQYSTTLQQLYSTLVPLKKVSINCELRGPTAATDVELTYMNTSEGNPMECEYIFPIDKSMILAKFEASIDGDTIET